MAGFRNYQRRLRHIFSSPAVRVIAICATLLLVICWVIQHKHNDSVNFPKAAQPTAKVEAKGIDWSKLYYVQYATSPEYLCNALMVWHQIEQIGSRAQRMLLYPSDWDPNEVDESDHSHGLTPIARLLQQAQKNYYVKLHPVEVLHQNNTEQETWADSYTKLLAFNLTDFDRVLAIDSDSIVKQNLDQLFLLPKATVAMPLIYWGEPEGWAFSSQMILITPSASEFKKVETAIKLAKPDEYDMDIINNLYKSEVVPISQRPWNLLSGEFRRKNHAAYLGSRTEKWDADLVLNEAKLIHFSDWPIQKPWIRTPKDLLNKHMPSCVRSEWFGASNCRDRTIWLKLYYDFALSRKAICGAGFELQSQELPVDSVYRHGKWYHPDEDG